MMKTGSDKIPVLLTLFTLIALPLALYGYRHTYLPRKFSSARIITLTALATDGVWTQEQVIGVNYWRKHFSPTPEIQVKLGETIILRLASADVLHSFSIPLLNIGPIDVPAGEVREVKFTVERPDTLLFLCWQVCSPVHEKLQGKFIVLGPDGQPADQTTEQEPDLDGGNTPRSEQRPDLDDQYPTQEPNLDEHHNHDGHHAPQAPAKEPDL